ncbi:MAG: hypothetical protein Q9165_000925 [Trypethelium subeluteriae]
MSLNGLDNPNITAAFQSALGEAGGWFVTLGPSARVTVHFQAITEKFSPFDTILTSNTPDGLNDSALAVAFPLHTASPSNSSSRLHEIAEDGEDTQIHAKRAESPLEEMDAGLPAAELNNESDLPKQLDTPVISVTDEKDSMLLKSNTVGSKIVVSEGELNRADMPNSDTEPSAQSPSYAHMTNYEFLGNTEDPPRRSTQSARTIVPDFSLYDIKPKVKLGPRPSLDAKRRPNTSGTNGVAGSRPISTLPAGLKMFPKRVPEQSRKSEDVPRPKSFNDNPTSSGINIPTPPPIPDVPVIAPTSPRPTSRGSTKSMPSSMTPEKKRLMKALELRRRKQLATAKAASAPKAKAEVNEPTPVAVEARPVEENSDAGHSSTSGSGAKADSGIGLQYEEKSRSDDTTNTTRSLDGRNEASDVSPESQAVSESRTEASADDYHSELASSTDMPEAAASISLGDISVAERYVPDSISHETTALETIAFRKEPVDMDEGTLSLSGDSKEPENSSPSLEIGENDLIASNLRQKRRGIVEPIQIHVSAENSEPDYLSDDSFMEELQSAKVEEAKSLSVSKSPATPVFSRRPSSTFANSRTPRPGSYVSSEKTETQADQISVTETRSTTQRLPSPTPPSQKSQEAANVSRQRTVSSGISKRIQALAEHSHSPSPPASNHSAIKTDGPHSFLALRKQSFRGQSRASVLSSPRLQRGSSKSEDSRVQTREEGQTTYQIHHKNGRPESISVTARIVRSPRAEGPELQSPSETGSLELYQSPLIINHQKAETATSRSPSPNKVPTPSSPFPQTHTANRSETVPLLPSEQPNRRSTSSAGPRTSESYGRHSTQARPSSDLKSNPPPTARSHQSNSSLASEDLSQENSVDANIGKRKSRTSRLFKRMSNSMSSANSHRRRSLAAMMSPSTTGPLEEESRLGVDESTEPLVEEQMLEKGSAWSPVVVGDLNIQFPDTLLWKRRWVQIDAQGFLILGLSKANEHQRGVTKKYHFSEFKRPFAPDQDRQELPNSVILDFRDGSTLQCASEDYFGQARVLEGGWLWWGSGVLPWYPVLHDPILEKFPSLAKHLQRLA